MAHFLCSGRRIARLSMLSVLLLSSSVPFVPGRAQARESETVAACQNESLRLPNHPDVQAIEDLFQRYLGFSPTILDLGVSDPQMARLIVQFSHAIAQKDALSSSDQVNFNRLRSRYSRAIALLDLQDEVQSDRFAGGRTLNGIASPIQGAPAVQGAPVPLAAPAVRGPLSKGRAQFGGGTQPAVPSRPTQEPSLELPPNFNTEDYARIKDNPFFVPQQVPLSTFSVDVDTASYSNVRRFLKQGKLPPKDAVRLEEMINYFDYDYAEPEAKQPFSVNTDMMQAPWNSGHKLVQIGLKGHEIKTRQPSNLVFLVDVSGSMRSPNKLQLLQRSLCLLVREMNAADRVTLVTYAGNAGLVLPPTPGHQTTKILNAIANLQFGGSTAGAAGINLAYSMAQRHFLPNGNNRVILATDGDFNVGQSSNAELERLIEDKREQGVFLSVLGFGTGNYKDAKMETLANKGNGNYAYIDTLAEARKVLVEDLTSTLFTIAKDVKIQVEFNPKIVQAYRLIGYENRLLKAQDFNDDRKDAGDIGAGHTVTALYEIIPTGLQTSIALPRIDELKYQQPSLPSQSSGNDELMQVKLRYKTPAASTSQLLTHTIANQDVTRVPVSRNLQLSSAIAMFGMLLRDSEFKGDSSLDQVSQRLQQLDDLNAYETELLRLVKKTKLIQQEVNKNALKRD